MIGSTKSEYALLALIRLAQSCNSGMTVREIAELEGISLKYLERVMSTLKNHGYVRSAVGARGGYSLSRPADEIVCGEVVRLFDRSSKSIASSNKSNGNRRTDGVEHLFEKTQAAIGNVLDRTTITDLLPKEKGSNLSQTVKSYLAECESGYMFHI